MGGGGEGVDARSHVWRVGVDCRIQQSTDRGQGNTTGMGYSNTGGMSGQVGENNEGWGGGRRIGEPEPEWGVGMDVKVVRIPRDRTCIEREREKREDR